jgi:hypothetical protein
MHDGCDVRVDGVVSLTEPLGNPDSLIENHWVLWKISSMRQLEEVECGGLRINATDISAA